MLFTATKGRCGRDLTIVGLNSTYSINVKEYQGPIKNRQSIETGNTGHTIRRKTMQKKKNMCWRPLSPIITAF